MLRDIYPFKSFTSRIAANAKQTVSSSQVNRILLFRFSQISKYILVLF